MVSQESMQVQGFQIAISQLIKMLLIVSDERRICTLIFENLAGTVKEFGSLWCGYKAKFVSCS